MDKLARLPAGDRQDIFTEAAARRGIRPTIIEKDFWVCVVLKLLFEKSRFAQSLVFKGGTSLSKVYGLIERFSEDIDLVLDWNLIGFGAGGQDPLQEFDSKAKQDRFNKEINTRAAAYIAETLCPELNDLLQREQMALSAAVDPDDPHAIGIRYPAAFPEAYIRPEVRLEIGPLASWVPSAIHTIRPYVFDVLPEVFQTPQCKVRAIAAERTFWEKALSFIRKHIGKHNPRRDTRGITTTSANSRAAPSAPLRLPLQNSCRTWSRSSSVITHRHGHAMTSPSPARLGCCR